ncbi:MAG TPA: STT3 domain-containing protein, partial [Geobacteraceae bacterium]
MGCILLAVFLRCSTYHDLLADDGRLLFLDPDSYDHLRRITLGLVSFPHIPVFDAYYGYPVGTGQVWSPFFDYLITAILFLATAGHGGAVAAESFGFWLSPLLAVGNVLAIYYLATRLLDRTAGLAAALVIAILPAHLMYSFAGLLDHHAAEPLLCLFLLHSLLAANEVGPATKSWHRGLATGALLVCSLLIWRGSVIFWGMAMVILFIQARCEVSAGNALSPAGQYGLRACLWAVLLLLPVCLFDFWGGAATISFARISWFHVILLVACAAALGMASRLSRLRSLVLLAAVVAGLALIASATGLSQFVSQFRAGLVVIFGNDPWLNTIDELRSILFPDGQFSLWYGAGFLSGLYYLCPFVLLSIVRDWLQHGRRELSDVVLLVLVSAFFVLPLFRERYMHLGGVAVAVCTGYLVSRLRYRFTSHMRHRPGCWAAGLSLVVLFLPIVPFLSDPGREVRLSSEEKHDLREALHWLKTRTPPTAGYLDPRQIPEYGVLADWSLGSLITYVAQRPAMATNFGWETHGLYESASFLALSNP